MIRTVFWSLCKLTLVVNKMKVSQNLKKFVSAIPEVCVSVD